MKQLQNGETRAVDGVVWTWTTNHGFWTPHWRNGDRNHIAVFPHTSCTGAGADNDPLKGHWLVIVSDHPAIMPNNEKDFRTVVGPEAEWQAFAAAKVYYHEQRKRLRTV